MLATVRDLSVGETLVGAEVLALYAFWLWFWSTGYPRIRLEVASATMERVYVDEYSGSTANQASPIQTFWFPTTGTLRLGK